MDLSKRALGFLCRQYSIILQQNRLANALGTCALSALMCATVCASAAFVAPENALAGPSGPNSIGEKISPDTTSWSSEGDISAKAYLFNSPAIGITAKTMVPLSLTFNSGHTLTVTSMVPFPDPTNKAFGIRVMTPQPILRAMPSNPESSIPSNNEPPFETFALTVNNSGSIKAKAILNNSGGLGIPNAISYAPSPNPSSIYKDASAYGISVRNPAPFGITTIINETDGTLDVLAKGSASEAYGMYALGSEENDLLNAGAITVKANGMEAPAYANANGMYAEKTGVNILTNEASGTVDVLALGAISEAYGMKALKANVNDILNAGAITIKANGIDGPAYANANGMYAKKADINILTNEASGTVDVSAKGADAEAYGMKALNSGVNDLLNAGAITVKANGIDGPAMANANGMYAGNASQNILLNEASGTIDVSAKGADAEAYGMKALNSLGENRLFNDGKLTVKTTGMKSTANGIYAKDAQYNTLANVEDGVIDVSAKGEMAKAYGMNLVWASFMSPTSQNQGNSANSNDSFAPAVFLLNDGKINVSAKGGKAEAYGMSVTPPNMRNVRPRVLGNSVNPNDPSGVPVSPDLVLLNKGTIDVSAKGDDAIAYGMSVVSSDMYFGHKQSPALNFIPVDPSGDSDIGLATPTMMVINTGTINVTAKAKGRYAGAAGIYLDGSYGDAAIVSNYGDINVTAKGAETYASQLEIRGCTAFVDTWTMKLGEKYSPSSEIGNDSGNHVFAVLNGGTLLLGTPEAAGANFTISGFGKGFVNGGTYNIRDMIYQNGFVDGYVASVSSPFDFVNLELVEAESETENEPQPVSVLRTPTPTPPEASFPSWEDQAIKCTVDLNKDNSPVHAGASHAVVSAKGHMDNINKLLSSLRSASGRHRGGARNAPEAQSDTAMMYADASTTFTDAGGSYVSLESPLWKAFLMPFYSTTSENNGAYDTNMGGLVVGASRPVGDDFVFGFHASLAKANSESTYTNSDAISYALGVNGVYNVDESLYFSGQLTGFFADNSLDMSSGTSAAAQKASADMDTYGMYIQLAAGYDIALAPEHTLTPELALSYMYAHMEGFDASFNGAGKSTPFSMDSENYDALYADASLRWTGMYDLGSKENGSDLGILKPTIKAGIRQALTDPEVSSTMNIFGASATTHSDANETAFTCEAGLLWDMGDVNTSLTYTGEFGDAEQSHMGMFKVEWEF